MRFNVNGLKARSTAIGAALMVPLFALAQAPADPFAATVTTATSKITEYGGALVGVAAVGVVFMIAIKYVKKIIGAS